MAILRVADSLRNRKREACNHYGSITRLLHSYNVYHFCYNIIKSGKNFHLPLIGRVSRRYVERVDVCCHLRA